MTRVTLIGKVKIDAVLNKIYKSQQTTGGRCLADSYKEESL